MKIKFKEGIAKDDYGGKLKFTNFELDENIPVVWGRFKTHGFYRYGYKRAGILDVIKGWITKVKLNQTEEKG